jgi:transposase
MATALLDDELWRLVEPLLPVRRPRFHHPSRKRLNDRRAPTRQLAREVRRCRVLAEPRHASSMALDCTGQRSAA